ncbi:MAG: transcription initiation factor IIB [Candidatus Lokiarchaeota archaeon]|nr:transcription initiation factor IIB [Candidatus Lokiarchaeota archaeon]MBD3338212.1 transcription initiation factor IIB [Candidatus Lokiarchaeota archaeon]
MINEVKEMFSYCPECKGRIISMQHQGDMVCSQCGLVISERSIDTEHSGRRAFTMSEKRNREHTGSPISSLIPDLGLTTVIDKKEITNPDLRRATKWNRRLTWDKRNLLIATTELKRISTNLNLPEHVKEEAMRLYKKAFERKLLRGRSINGMVAACLYFSCRNKRVPRTFQEIMEEAAGSAKNIRQCYRTIIKELKLKVPNTNPIALVPRFVSELNLESEIESLSIKLLKSYIKSSSLSGKDPKGVCAGAIYLACKIRNINLTQRKAAELIGVTEVTLRSRYREIAKVLKIKG